MRKRFEDKGLWRGWRATPHPTINWQIFSEYYDRDPDIWDRAFDFLKNTDLMDLDAGMYDIEPGKLMVMVQEYTTREIPETQYEAHLKFADIQYVAVGTERIGIANLKDTRVIKPYDSRKDIVFLHAVEEQVYRASQDIFFVFFPNDAHRPCMKDKVCARVKKVVAKIRLP